MPNRFRKNLSGATSSLYIRFAACESTLSKRAAAKKLTGSNPRKKSARRWGSGLETGYDSLMAAATRDTLALIDRLMLEMIAQQESKVLAMARAIHPGLTPED